MVGLTYRHTLGLASTQIFGFAKGRTAWTIYNASTDNVYWANSRMGSTASGFRIPAGGSFSLKIPEDDPKTEVWGISEGASSTVYVYEGFGNG